MSLREQVANFLAANSVCLEVVAKERYAAMGGDDDVADLANHVATPFSALEENMLKVLDLHAQWQVHACHAVHRDTRETFSS